MNKEKIDFFDPTIINIHKETGNTIENETRYSKFKKAVKEFRAFLK